MGSRSVLVATLSATNRFEALTGLFALAAQHEGGMMA